MAQNHVRLWLLVLGIAALGGANACLSDVSIPGCLSDHSCGIGGGDADAAGIGESGAAGADAGSENGGARAGTGGGRVAGAGHAGASAGTGGAGSSGAGSGAPESGGPGSGGPGGGGSSGANGLLAGAGRVEAGGDAGADTWCCLELPRELPPPCMGQPYSTPVRVDYGKSPYHWTVSGGAGTWRIVPDPSHPDGSRVSLQGEPAATATELTLVVTDANNHQQSATYPLLPRRACYFAYVAAKNGQGRLELLDPLLNVPPPVALANNASVFDFEFSPDGRFLAYRFGQGAAHPHGAHLSLVDLVGFQDQTLLLGDEEVTAFEWSADSRTLAVAFSADQVSYLGGVELEVTKASASLHALTATPAGATTALSWFSGKYLAFSAESDEPGYATPYFSQLLSDGFDVPLQTYDFYFKSAPRLKGNDLGFFATGFPTSAARSVFYGPLTDDYFAANHASEFVAPSGHFTAQLLGASLQIRGADQDLSAAPLTQSPPGTGCPKLLTWAEQRERIACVADVAATATLPAHGEIRIFDLDSPPTSQLAVSTVQGYCTVPSDPVPTAQTCAPLEYDYTQGSSALQTRQFSPSGRWLAVTKAKTQPGVSTLYLADLSRTPMVVVRNSSIVSTTAVTDPVVLAFSPDEEFLLRQDGTFLTILQLAAPQNTGINSTSLPISSQIVLDPNAGSGCLEDYATAPQRWCGATDRSRPFGWSPDSRWYAYRSSDNGEEHLTIASIAMFPDVVASYTFVAADCAGVCSGDFAFQP